MKKIIRFSKFFIPAAVISCILAGLGLTGYIVNNGFNLGVDFQAGLIQEVQLAPTAFSIKWNGTSNAVLRFDSTSISIAVSGAGTENRTFSFSFNEYNTIGSITQAMMRQIEGLEITLTARANINSQWLKFSTYGNTELGSATPFIVHYLEPESVGIQISDVRMAMA
ncbi:MAG: protein translocase subunit SecF, partial [Treponema sp.]|nr:protein translocase subunit SecF [Treponema sp.]